MRSVFDLIAFALTGTAASVLASSGDAATYSMDSFLRAFEVGGFLLLTLLSIGFFVKALLPQLLAWLKEYLDRLETRNQDHLNQFLEELARQREARDRQQEALRDLLRDQEQNIITHIREQTKLLRLIAKLNVQQCRCLHCAQIEELPERAELPEEETPPQDS